MAAVQLQGFLSSVSVEPVVLINSLAGGLKYGAGILEKLIFDKVCLYKLNYPEYICANLTDYEDENYHVQEVVNEFNLYKSLMANILRTVGSLFVGAFADKYGLKTCILISFLGTFLGDLIDYLNYAFLEELPLEALYADIITQFLSSIAWFLAIYGLISRYASKSQMATRMAFVDGFNTIAFTLGTAPSAVVFRAVGYYGVFGISTALNVIAFLYAVFLLNDYPKGYVKSEEESAKSNARPRGISNILKSSLFDPLKDLYTALARPRSHHIRPMLITCFCGMLLYYATLQELGLYYPYMYLMFNVTPEEYSLFNVASNIVGISGLFLLMPFFTSVLKLHETSIMAFALGFGALTQTASAYVDEIIPGFLVTSALANLRFLVYPNGRALLAKMVGPEEVPKMYGILNVIVGVIGLVGIPVYRGLYDATLETFPGAFLILSASINTAACFIYMCLYTQKRHIVAAAKDRAAMRRKQKASEERDEGKSDVVDGLHTPPPDYKEIVDDTAL